MIIYILYLGILMIVLILFILQAVWCCDPSLLVNLKYSTNLDLKELDEPHLFICQHDNIDDLKIMDQIMACTEATKTKLKMNIVSYDSNKADRISSFFKKLPLFPKYNLLYTGNKLVEKSKEILKKEHIWIFLKKDWKSGGIYHILSQHKEKIPIYFIRVSVDDNIKKENSFLSRVFNRTYKMEYERCEDYELGDEPEKFMKFVKNKLFLDTKNNE
jgi:hypothetical protein